jgi:hypothetical protein
MDNELCENELVRKVLKNKLSVYFDQREKRNGRPWIIFRRHRCVLAEFETVSAAMRWLPPYPVTSWAVPRVDFINTTAN